MATLFRILFFGDNSDIVERVESQLKKLNEHVKIDVIKQHIELQNYLEKESLPDVIVYEYDMPGQETKKSFKKIRKKHSYLPLIVLSDYLNENEAVELMRDGATDVITKERIEWLGPAISRELHNFKEREQSQKEIEVAHDRFRALVEQGGDVVVVLGVDGNPTYITPSVHSIFGYTVKEAMQINIGEVTHPEDFRFVENALNEAMESPGKNIPIPPIRLKKKNGSWRWFKTSITDLRHEPSVNGIVDNIQDIHDQVLNARANSIMLNHTEESFVFINRDLAIQSFNNLFKKNYKEFFGEHIQVGGTILGYAQPERREIVKDIYRRVFEGETIERELSFEAPDGEVRYFQIKYKPAKDENGKIIGSFTSVVDTTKEKEALRELEENEARYRALVENGRDVIVLFDENIKPFYVSSTIENVLGYSKGEALDLDLTTLVHPDDQEEVAKVIQESFKNPGTPIQGYTSRVSHKDGSWRWVEATVTNLLDDPTIRGIVDNFRDVTERMDAEKKIREAKDKYQTLVQSINGIFWEAEPDTFKATYISPQIQKMLGYNPEKWLSTEDFWINHIHQDERDEVNQKYKQATKAGRNHELEYRFLKSDGEYIWIRDIISVITNNGEVEVIRGIMTDITQEKELETKLDQAYKLSKIGSWELNLENNTLYWSRYINELLEVDKDFKPDLESAINFYKEGRSRQEISKALEHAIEEGISFDIELPIITANGNERWIRTVGSPDYIENSCVRVFGSIQDIHNRKQAELELEEAYKEKEIILESIGDGFFTLNRDWIVTYWNNAAEKLLHTSREKILGKNLWSVFDDAIDLPSYKNYQKVMNEGIPVNFNDYYVPIDSWFDINAYPSENGISVYFKDITERIKNEEKIRRVNERFHKVTEATNDAIWDFDVLKNNLFWGKGFETLFGYDLNKTSPNMEFLLNQIHPDDRARIAKKIQKFMKDGIKKDWFEEYRFKKADGEYAYVMDRAIFIRNNEGKVVRIVGAMTDLTQQVEEEKQLKLYESVVTNTQESVVITEAVPKDIQGRKILYVNEAFTKMTGYRREEVLGRTLGFLNGPKTDEETLDKLREAMKNYMPIEVEFINYKKNDEEFWINTSMVPVADSKGNYIHWVAIGRDVTSRRKYEDEIQTSLVEKETLLAEIHHRVKNNLAVISGMMQLQAYESENLELQDKLFDSVSRIKTMATVHELLYHTKSFSDINFSETLEYLIRSVSSTLQSNGNIKVDINSEPVKLNINQAIPVSLIVNEVITNVYKHAFKNRKSGKIKIRFQEKNDRMLLQIEDNGGGLPSKFNKNDVSSMGLKLINVLSEQINAEYDFVRLKTGTKFEISFERSDIKGIGNVYMS